MNWAIDSSEKDGIVFAKTYGPVTREQNRKFVEEMLSPAGKKGLRRFLVDHQSIETHFSVLQIDDLPNMLREMGAGPEDKIAILGNPSWAQQGEFSFFKDVLTLRSPQIQFFLDKDEAIAWLKSGPSGGNKK